MRRLALLFAIVGCQAKNDSTNGASSSTFSASSSPSSEAKPRASSCGDEVIVEEGIGALRIGTPVASVRKNCTVIHDTTGRFEEGMPSRKLTVAFPRDTVEAEIVVGRVWRLSVRSPRMRTADSIGVGTPISRLLRLRKPHGMTGEGAFFLASPDHCGMSFRLENTGPGVNRGDLDSASLTQLSASTVVSEVLVFGCHL